MGGLIPLVTPYSLFLGLACAIGLLDAAVRMHRTGRLDTCKLPRVYFCAVAGGVIGAKALFLIEHAQTATPPISYQELRYGFSLVGGIAGGLCIAGVYLRAKMRNPMHYVDALTPALALAIGIGKVGCFLNGCCSATPAPVGATASERAGAALQLDSIPLQLAVTAAAWVAFSLTAAVHRSPGLSGYVFGIFLLCFGTLRGTAYLLLQGRSRVPAPIDPVSTSLMMLAVGLLWVGWIYRRRIPRREGLGFSRPLKTTDWSKGRDV